MKNSAQLGKPLTLDVRVLYVGTFTSWLNNVGEFSLQFGAAGQLKRLASSAGGDGELIGAVAGGMVVAPFCSILDLVLLQQQRAAGGSTLSTLRRVVGVHGLLSSGLLRGVKTVAPVY